MNKKMNENKDLLITGVQILDGSLQKPFEGEVLLSGEKILDKKPATASLSSFDTDGGRSD